jgi:hypothetical protein
MLESLVLRGVSVRLDGSAVIVRRGTGSDVGRAPGVALLTRVPSPDRPQGFPKPAAWQDQPDANQVAHATGAGRSPRRPGSLCRSGGLKAMAATYSRRHAAMTVATVGEPAGAATGLAGR